MSNDYYTATELWREGERLFAALDNSSYRQMAFRINEIDSVLEGKTSGGSKYVCINLESGDSISISTSSYNDIMKLVK